jgi:hypothetical protein
MKLFALAVLFVFSSLTFASPCDRVDRNLSEERKNFLAPIVTAQVARELPAVQSVEVLQSFRLGHWHIIKVETHVSDEGYLFYKDDPAKTKYLTVWGGSVPATDDEYRFIVKSLSEGKTRGIPKALARCFAWHMTKEPPKQ